MGKPYYCHTNLGIAMVKTGWTVQRLSFATRIPTRTLGFYLKGEKQLPPDHLRVIAQTLDIDPRSIFQPLTILHDITPHQDHRAAVSADLKLLPYPSQEPEMDSTP